MTYDHERYLRKRESQIRASKRYYELNKEKCLARQKNYNALMSDKIKEYQDDYRRSQRKADTRVELQSTP